MLQDLELMITYISW